jgi:hypothetical protein
MILILVDIILVMNGVDISVFEADFSKSYINVLGNFFFPPLAFGGLFFLFKIIHVVFSK